MRIARCLRAQIRPCLAAVADWLLPAAAVGRLRVLRERVRPRPYPEREVEHTYGSRAFRVLIRSGYAECYDADWPDLPEIQALRRGRLREGAVVFNLGANHGVIAMMLADAVGSTGRVVALEASRLDAEAAATNARMNGLEQMEVLHAAAARSTGMVEFGTRGAVDDGSGRYGRISVPAWSLSSLAETYGTPDVVYMDVEGFEGDVLAGAGALLAEPVDWFVEVHGEAALGQYGSSVAAVLGRFDRSRHDLLVGADRLMRVHGEERLVSMTEFAPLDDEGPPADRFFLLALTHA